MTTDDPFESWREVFAAQDLGAVETQAEEVAAVAADAVRRIAARAPGRVQEAAEDARSEIGHAIAAIVAAHERSA